MAYTGDLRLHGKNGDATREFVSQAKDASVLITEGTRAGPSDEEKTSEQAVCETCRVSVESSSDLVIADISPRNFERLVLLRNKTLEQSIYEICMKNIESSSDPVNRLTSPTQNFERVEGFGLTIKGCLTRIRRAKIADNPLHYTGSLPLACWSKDLDSWKRCFSYS